MVYVNLAEATCDLQKANMKPLMESVVEKKQAPSRTERVETGLLGDEQGLRWTSLGNSSTHF